MNFYPNFVVLALLKDYPIELRASPCNFFLTNFPTRFDGEEKKKNFEIYIKYEIEGWSTEHRVIILKFLTHMLQEHTAQI